MINIVNYMIFSAAVVFVLYAVFAQGKKKKHIKSEAKPNVAPIEIYKVKGRGLQQEQLKKLE